MAQEFTGKVAIVTGAASGIGKATARDLAARGAAVAVTDRDGAAASAVASAIASEGGNATAYRLDVADSAEVDQTVEAIVREFGGLDILAHSAGIQRYGTAVTTSNEVWAETLGVNVTGAFYMSRAVIPHLIERGGGSVIIVGSVQSLGGVGNSTAYVASKHAVLGLVRCIAVDFAGQGIRAHCVCPGAIDTPMLQWGISQASDPEQSLVSCKKLHLIRRLGQPEEVARVIAFLASSESSFMTGQPIYVEGGAMTPVGGAEFVEGAPGNQ